MRQMDHLPSSSLLPYFPSRSFPSVTSTRLPFPTALPEYVSESATAAAARNGRRKLQSTKVESISISISITEEEGPGNQTVHFPSVAAPGEVAGMFVRPIPPDQLELSWAPASAASTLEALVTDPRGDGSSTRAWLRPLIDHATPGE